MTEQSLSPPNPSMHEPVTAAESKLSPELQLMVRSDEFKAWFGDWQNDPSGAQTSKMIDAETGEPQLFYHGTNRQFDAFERHETTKQAYPFTNVGLEHDTQGIYATASAKIAEQYADPLGFDWNNTMYNIGQRFNLGYYSEVIDLWNDLLASCQRNDGSVSIKERDTEFSTSDIAQLAAEKTISHASFLMYKGEVVMWVGEFLQLIGGRFPTQEDQLVPYKPLVAATKQKVESLIEEGGSTMLIPDYAEPRILPVFVKALNPLEEKVDGGPQSVDMAFANGFHTMQTHPNEGHDAVIANGKGTGFDVNLAVIHPEQLFVAEPLKTAA